MIGAQVLHISKQDYDPQGASVTILIAEEHDEARPLSRETHRWPTSTRAT